MMCEGCVTRKSSTRSAHLPHLRSCVNAVKRILSKTEGENGATARELARCAEGVALRSPGVESFDVSLETKKVTVQGSASPELLLEKLSKTGKATSLWT